MPDCKWGSHLSEAEVLAIANNVEAKDAEIARLKQELDNWIETARQESRNRDYYRGLLVSIGEPFGVAARTQDDGGIVDEVLVAKVPELVVSLREALLETREALRQWADHSGDPASPRSSFAAIFALLCVAGGIYIGALIGDAKP